MKEIEKFINFSSNDKLSLLNDRDIFEFISLLVDYKLSYRDTLNIDEKYTFGIEIESNNLSKIFGCFSYEGILNNITHFNWSVVTDLTLHKGLEINSPIMIDNINYWNDIKLVCEKTRKYGKIGQECGGHIHVGSNILEQNKDYLIRLLNIWKAYEHIIYRYSSNEYNILRVKNNKYAMSITQTINDFFKENESNDLSDEMFFNLFRNYQSKRNYSINFQNMTYAKENSPGNTIEFRIPNGTLDEVIWQNNINTFIKIILAAKKPNLEYDIILNKIRNNNNPDYMKINTLDALEFVDLVFDKNIDKIYFLKQYLKSNNDNFSYFAINDITMTLKK